jgi:hypothetical protein
MLISSCDKLLVPLHGPPYTYWHVKRWEKSKEICCHFPAIQNGAQSTCFRQKMHSNINKYVDSNIHVHVHVLCAYIYFQGKRHCVVCKNLVLENHFYNSNILKYNSKLATVLFVFQLGHHTCLFLIKLLQTCKRHKHEQCKKVKFSELL